jgi:hypothetical protein
LALAWTVAYVSVATERPDSSRLPLTKFVPGVGPIDAAKALGPLDGGVAGDVDSVLLDVACRIEPLASVARRACIACRSAGAIGAGPTSPVGLTPCASHTGLHAGRPTRAPFARASGPVRAGTTIDPRPALAGRAARSRRAAAACGTAGLRRAAQASVRGAAGRASCAAVACARKSTGTPPAGRRIVGRAREQSDCQRESEAAVRSAANPEARADGRSFLRRSGFAALPPASIG